jgi:hypothetical protein
MRIELLQTSFLGLACISATLISGCADDNTVGGDEVAETGTTESDGTESAGESSDSAGDTTESDTTE